MARWTPSNWASWKPFGIGEQRPNNYLEILKALRENRSELAYAWRILNQGVCDGCALGTSGLHDWTLDGTHVCNIRLRLLRLNTMPALDVSRLADVESLRALSSEALLQMGRLPYPMVRRRGERGFTQVTWDDALNLIAEHIHATTPDRLGFYLTSRGMPNESYYAAQKAVRAMGTNSIDNAARICHSPSTTALKEGIGYAATTCSYKDWLRSDLLVFIGSNVANNQPVATKYIHYAKKNGAKVLVVNPYREPGMEHYWIPSVVESALFGTKIADRFFSINVGGDIAFLNGAVRHIIEHGGFDRRFVENYTTGFDGLHSMLAGQSWDLLERASGTTRKEMEAFAGTVMKAQKAVFVWSMGVTQHVCGEDNVRAIINLALTRGFVGRDGCGLMPIRGHSGVQGGAEMGAYATAFPGGLSISADNAAKFSELWGFEVPASKGFIAPEMIDRAHDGAIEVLFTSGGNFLEVLPDPEFVDEALGKIPLRVHMDIILSKQMLVDPADTVVLLPAATRYETPGGVTQTSTERRVIFSPEIPGRRIGEARPEWDAFMDLARRVRPDIAEKLNFDGTAAIREEIATAVPVYDGIQRLQKAGDQFQYGGEHLCEGWKFNTADGKARFMRVAVRDAQRSPNTFVVSTRRGKQFNSMVHEKTDAITGAGRDAVFISAEDAKRLTLKIGEAVILRNNGREYHGHIYIAPVKPGNLQIHWPEGNVLIDRTKRSPDAGVPDYNATVTLEKFV